MFVIRAVSRWLMKQLAARSLNGGACAVLWRKPSTKQPNSQINQCYVGGVNGRNTETPWPLSVLKIVEVLYDDIVTHLHLHLVILTTPWVRP